MIAALTQERSERCLALLRDHVLGNGPSLSETWLDFGGRKKVKVVGYDPAAKDMVLRQSGWCSTEPSDRADATIFFWKEPDINHFHNNVLGFDFEIDKGDDYLLFARKDEGGHLEIFAEIELAAGVIKIWDGDEYYFGTEQMEPESLLRSGHLFYKCFYRILDTPSTSMVHSACVGIDGKGVLICARGGKGKTTLAVSSMLKGFEYVSDDYTMLEKTGDMLTASPLYSVITLSPKIYSLLYDYLANARFIADNARKNKYFFDISAWGDSFRKQYPVVACLFPDIRPDVEEPEIIPCSPIEKGRTITHVVHSTQMQMMDQGNTLNSRKLIGMLQGLDFYRIVLSPDLFKNVECLREFIVNLKTNNTAV